MQLCKILETYQNAAQIQINICDPLTGKENDKLNDSNLFDDIVNRHNHLYMKHKKPKEQIKLEAPIRPTTVETFTQIVYI